MAKDDSKIDFSSSREKYYHSWLLRIWQEHEDAPWSIELQEVRDCHTELFESLPSLFDHLIDRIRSSSE